VVILIVSIAWLIEIFVNLRLQFMGLANPESAAQLPTDYWTTKTMHAWLLNLLGISLAFVIKSHSRKFAGALIALLFIITLIITL